MSTEMFPIVPVSDGYEAGWRRLFDGYADFYRRPMNDRIAATTWAALLDPENGLNGVIALQEDIPVGLAHFAAMARPLAGGELGYLHDLFVDPGVRGWGIGEMLITHVADVGRARGWMSVRWLTGDDNYRARALYDRVARKTSWNLYELELDSPG